MRQGSQNFSRRTGGTPRFPSRKTSTSLSFKTRSSCGLLYQFHWDCAMSGSQTSPTTTILHRVLLLRPHLTEVKRSCAEDSASSTTANQNSGNSKPCFMMGPKDPRESKETQDTH